MFEHSVETGPRRASGREPTPVAPLEPSRPEWGVVLAYLALVLLGAVLGALWVWRDRLQDAFGPWFGPWWFVAVPMFVVTVMLRVRPRPPKSASHPAMQVRRAQHWNYRPVMRPLGRRGLVPNVFVDGDSFAEAAWPGADLAVSRRWTVDASERVASRFGTEVVVVLGVGGAGSAGREHVRVVAVDERGSMRDALWELIAPVDPQLPILFVTDDEAAAREALAHGVQIMPCRGWMNLADRLVATADRNADPGTRVA